MKYEFILGLLFLERNKIVDPNLTKTPSARKPKEMKEDPPPTLRNPRNQRKENPRSERGENLRNISNQAHSLHFRIFPPP